jgi:hypothetical protein
VRFAGKNEIKAKDGYRDFNEECEIEGLVLNLEWGSQDISATINEQQYAQKKRWYFKEPASVEKEYCQQ